jgi:hypothetical protein
MAEISLSFRPAVPLMGCAALLGHVIAAVEARGMNRLSLKTGTMAYFAPARRLYGRSGSPEVTDVMTLPTSL